MNKITNHLRSIGDKITNECLVCRNLFTSPQACMEHISTVHPLEAEFILMYLIDSCRIKQAPSNWPLQLQIEPQRTCKFCLQTFPKEKTVRAHEKQCIKICSENKLETNGNWKPTYSLTKLQIHAIVKTKCYKIQAKCTEYWNNLDKRSKYLVQRCTDIDDKLWDKEIDRIFAMTKDEVNNLKLAYCLQ